MHVRLFVWLIGCIVFFSSPPNLKLRRQFGATPTVAALCMAPHLITSRTQPAMSQIAASPPTKQPDTSRQPPSMACQPPGASQTSPRSQFLPWPPRHVWLWLCFPTAMEEHSEHARHSAALRARAPCESTPWRPGCHRPPAGAQWGRERLPCLLPMQDTAGRTPSLLAFTPEQCPSWPRRRVALSPDVTTWGWTVFS